jgi:hypothetical protein
MRLVTSATGTNGHLFVGESLLLGLAGRARAAVRGDRYLFFDRVWPPPAKPGYEVQTIGLRHRPLH